MSQELRECASSREEATKALRGTDYFIPSHKLTRRLDAVTGCGFWDIIIGVKRVIYYGPGEYVQPHYHDMDENFEITHGGCDVFILGEDGSWIKSFENRTLSIPAGVKHCLVAGREGLCMESDNNPDRDTNWVTLDIHTINKI